MPRVRTGFTRKRRHKKILKATKGYYGTNSKLYRRAHEAYLKAGEHAFTGRKKRKRDMKRLWIIRLNAGVEQLGYNYSNFIHKLRGSKIKLDRKILAQLAAEYPKTFKEVTDRVMQ